MSTEIKVPQLPESVSEATLVNWHKQAGESVERDENLVDIETDKVVLECPAPSSGVLKEIRAKDGESVGGGDVIAILEAGEAGAATEAGKEQPAESRSEKDHGEEKITEREEEEPRSKSASERLSPSVRRLVEEYDLDPARIEGSGKNGRLTKSDVTDYLKRQESGTTQKEESVRQAPAADREPAVASRGERAERRVPMSRLRARIAERMVESQQTAALLTSFNEVDLGRVMDLRHRYREKFEKEHGVRLGLMSFFVKAAIEALKRYPVINASVESNEIVYHDYWDIGIAVSTSKGLIVPILRNADQMGFAEIEQGIRNYASKAREGGLSLDDITGGTFTITNGGVFGSLMSTPIINPPQSGILGMHKIQERPMVVDGQVVVRPMMYIAITYDHRIVDGREAVLFLVAIKEVLEDPGRLLLQI